MTLVNCVMLVHNRPKLTKQAIESFIRTTANPCNLLIVDDASDDHETLELLDSYAHGAFRIKVVSNIFSLGVGGSRNRGIRESQAHFGRGDYLYLSDNDAFFTPGWLEVLLMGLKSFPKVKLLGGYCHPYSQPNETLGKLVTRGANGTKEWVITSRDAICGLSWLLSWETWDTYGPLLDNARGTCQSEDFEWSQRVVKSGFKVAAVEPWVVLNAGRTNSLGQPSPGWEIASPEQAGVLFE